MMLAGILANLLGMFFLIICILLIVVVLLQRGRGGGLSAALGGAASSAFGTKTGDVFTWVTIVLVGLFLLLAMGTVVAMRPEAGVVGRPVLVLDGQAVEDVIEVQGPTRLAVRVGTPNNEVYVTRDGTEPSPRNGERFSAPTEIIVRPGETVKLRAYRTAWTPSQTVTLMVMEAQQPDANAPAGPGPAGDGNVPAMGAPAP
jgi:preprotein translocase subunit SecG